MTTIRERLKSHAVLIYFAVVFFISWGGGLIIVGPKNLPLRWQQFERLGPLLYVAMLAGPSVAGVLLTGLMHGRSGFRDLLSRLLRWRVGWTAYALALAPALLITATTLLLSLIFPDFRPAMMDSHDKADIVMRAIALSLLFGFFEELGWTGFAVPHLRSRHAPLTTGLIVGVVWGAWHFPLFWEGDTFSGLLPLTMLVVRLFSWLPPFRVLMVGLHDRTGSLPVVMLMHAFLVATQVILASNRMAGTHLLTHLLVLPAIVWLLLAAAAAANQRKRSPLPLRTNPV
jgi:membrane protease YdiL (CAAX protease family)